MLVFQLKTNLKNNYVPETYIIYCIVIEDNIIASPKKKNEIHMHFT
jgi:hypothetical protein